MYIGATPQIGGYHKLDAITTDGSASYTMQLNSGNFVPESANHLIVSVNGVIQAPVDSFTVSASTITFASSLSVSDTIDFIMALGNTLDIGTPSDSTVSLSKLTATGTKDATTFLRGDNTFAVPVGGVNTPSFKAYRTANQSLAHNTWTKIEFNVEDYDTDSAYDNSTNYRFTVPSDKAGKYLFCYALNVADMGDNQRVGIKLYVNGSPNEYTWVQLFSTGGGNLIGRVGGATILDLSVSDYVEVYGRQAGGSSKNFNGGERNEFSAFRLIGV